MSASASELEREVEASRASVEGTVEALKDKMSIGQMVDEATRYFGDSGGSQMVANLGTQIRDNPLPLVLIGVGLAWLMSGRGTPHMSSGFCSGRGERADYPEYNSLDQDEYRRTFGESAVYSGASHPDYASRSTGDYESWSGGEREQSEGGMRSAASGAASGIGSAASGLASGIASAASSVASGVGAVASGLGSAASGVGSAASSLGRTAFSAAGTVAGGTRAGAGAAWRGGSEAYRGASSFGSGAYSGASRFGRGASRSFSSVLDTEPLVLGAVGLAIGAAIGAMLPRTDAENRYLGETSDQWREDVESYAREQFERGKAVAEEAYTAAKAEAEAQGLTPDELLGRVGDIARAGVGRAREAAEEQGLSGGQSSGSSPDESSGSGTSQSDFNRGSTT